MKAVRRVAALATSATASVAAARYFLGSKRDHEAAALLRAATFDANSPEQSHSIATSMHNHGFAFLSGVLTPLDPELEESISLAPEGFDVAKLAAMAGAMLASTLPTRGYTDGKGRQSTGEKLGERAAAQALAMQAPKGCVAYAQAVAKLEPHSRSRASPVLPATSPMRSLILHAHPTVVAADVDGWDPNDDDDDDIFGSISHEGSLLRSWASVLFAAATHWESARSACCHLRRCVYDQPAVTLIAPAASGGSTSMQDAPPPLPRIEDAFLRPQQLQSEAAIVPSWLTRWMPFAQRQFFGGGDGFTVLLPVPMPPPTSWTAPSSVVVDVLLPPPPPPPSQGTTTEAAATPAELVTAVRVRVRVGSALIVDSRARWRIVEELKDPEQHPQPALVVYEYAGSRGGAKVDDKDGQPASSGSILRQAAVAIALGPPGVLDAL